MQKGTPNIGISGRDQVEAGVASGRREGSQAGGHLLPVLVSAMCHHILSWWVGILILSLLSVAATSVTKQVTVLLLKQTRAGMRKEWESGANCPIV